MGERDVSESWIRLLGGTSVKSVDVEARVSRVAWVSPPADLRARVLAAAPVRQPAISWSDRVWFSRAWRFAAVAVVLILAALESMSAPARPPAVPASAQEAAEARFVDETARQAGLSPEQAAALARRAATAERPARPGNGFGGIALDDLDSGGEPR
jgi:hypothetical protein